MLAVGYDEGVTAEGNHHHDYFFFQAEDGIRDKLVTGVQTCALPIFAGAPRKVLMQAPKNGFFYVIDRANGQLISAKPYTNITWATGVDPKTGRPIENPAARYEKAVTLQVPGPLGAHNWQPMAFNPKTGLVYIPTNVTPFAYTDEQAFNYKAGAWNLGVDFLVNALPSDAAT